MPISVSGRNDMLDALGTTAQYVSLHSADPGANGTNGELTGGNPAYARKQVSWAAAAAPSKTSSSAVTFDIPPGTTVAFYGLWTAPTGGVFKGSNPLSASETFTGQGNYTIAVGGLTLTAA